MTFLESRGAGPAAEAISSVGSTFPVSSNNARDATVDRLYRVREVDDAVIRREDEHPEGELNECDKGRK